MNITKIILLFLILATTRVYTQPLENDWPGKFFMGYTRSLTAGKFSYHSPQPDVTTSLLLRSIDSASFIAWETEQIPADLKDPSVNFIWMFGIDANSNPHKYKLFLNGKYLLTFGNPVTSTMNSWVVSGADATSLLFRTTMLDKYDDPMGYAILTVPARLLEKGKPQVIKITGESAASRVWYMTFEAGITEKVDILQEEAVVKEEGKPRYSVLFNFVHLGKPENVTVKVPGVNERMFRLEPGFNSIRMLLPFSEKESSYEAFITRGENTLQQKIQLHPVRPWTIYLVQHTHTDIGYTRPQTEILPDHLRYIDYALDFCDQTDGLPEDAKFRWTCETSWAVKEYLDTRPKEQVDRLIRRIKEGRIEVTGLYLNSSDLSDEAMVAWYLQPVKQFREAGIPVTAAMQDDINGVPWCLTDYLPGCGIRSLTMAQNTHRAHKPFENPTLFWWESPSGNRLLVNRPEHYMFGNSLGILTNTETFGKALFTHLRQISEKGYPYDQYSIQFSGYLTDNSPPSTTACAIVKQWNEQYQWPRLKLATVSEFLGYMEMNHGAEFPVCRGAWPDWWMDGFGSAALETAYTRQAHEDFISNQALMAMLVMLGGSIPGELTRKLYDAGEQIALYDEHTFGAAESITDPLVENSVVQWQEKAAYAWSAVKENRILREEILGRLQPFLPKSGLPTFTLFNTLNLDRPAMATIYLDHEIIPRGKPFTILNGTGREVPCQKISEREEGAYWSFYLDFLPALGTRTYKILSGSGTMHATSKEKFSGILENNYYRLVIDSQKGAVASLTDKLSGRELCDPSAKYPLGQFIYERLGRNRNQLELLKLDDYTRVVWNEISVGEVTEGELWKSVTIKGKVPGCADVDGITCEIRLYNREKKIELLYSMKKLPVTDPEGVYVSFPFRVEGGVTRYEVQGGTVIAGRDQIAGSAADWQGIQNFASVRNNDFQVVLTSPEIPLVQLGDINLGKFARSWEPSTSHIYSWVLNNYWTTNFRAYQEGELKWRYLLTSGNDTTNAFAARFGWGERIPVVSRVFPATNDSLGMFAKGWPDHPPMIQLLGPSARNLLLVSAKPSSDNKGVILQLREVNGKAEPLAITLPAYSSSTSLKDASKAKAVYEVNVLEEVIGPVSGMLEFRPYETKFIKLEF